MEMTPPSMHSPPVPHHHAIDYPSCRPDKIHIAVIKTFHPTGTRFITDRAWLLTPYSRSITLKSAHDRFLKYRRPCNYSRSNCPQVFLPRSTRTNVKLTIIVCPIRPVRVKTEARKTRRDARINKSPIKRYYRWRKFNNEQIRSDQFITLQRG